MVILWVVFGSIVIVVKVISCVIYGTLTDKTRSGMCGGARVISTLCTKHENALWVISLGDFVLESPFCAQRSWILNQSVFGRLFLYCFQTTLRLFSYKFILFLHFCIQLFLMYFHNICVLLLFFFRGILILFSKYFYCICKYEYFTKFRNRLNRY